MEGREGTDTWKMNGCGKEDWAEVGKRRGQDVSVYGSRGRCWEGLRAPAESELGQRMEAADFKILTHDRTHRRWRLSGQTSICFHHLGLGYSSSTEREQYSTYWGESGSRELHVPRRPVALQHLQAEQHVSHGRHILTLETQREQHWASAERTIP